MGTQSIYLKPKTEKMLYDYAEKARIPASKAILTILEAALAPEKPADNFEAPIRHKYHAQDGTGFDTLRAMRAYQEEAKATREASE